MELVTELIGETLFNPVLLATTAVLTLLLLTGLPARTVEAWDSRGWRR